MATETKLYTTSVLPENVAASQLKLYGPSGDYAAVLQGPTGMSANIPFIFPSATGPTGNFLTTDGTGQTIWTSYGTGPTGSVLWNATGSSTGAWTPVFVLGVGTAGTDSIAIGRSSLASATSLGYR